MIEDRLYLGSESRIPDYKGRICLNSLVREQVMPHYLENPNKTFQDVSFFLHEIKLEKMNGIILSEFPSVKDSLEGCIEHYKVSRPDKNGRISLGDKKSREILNNSRDLIIIANIDHFEVYDRKTWEEQLGQVKHNMSEAYNALFSGY